MTPPRPVKTITAADLFCGAGGSSTALTLACERLGYRLDLTAINHWSTAIATHSANHPGARHLCESLDSVDPRKLFPAGRLNLLLASPECTHFSQARGGKPCSDQSRASAWHIVRWAEALYVDTIVIENVPEFRTWGPLGANGRRMKSHEGQTFTAFVNSLRSLGYTAEWRILNAADYGDPTTRERFFLIAKRGGKKIVWPEPTHARNADSQAGLFGNLKPWTPARDVIDWTLDSQSIFNRHRLLAPATLRRIEAGLPKFAGKNAEPFLVVLRNYTDARSLSEPVPAITAGGQHLALCEPFVMPLNHGALDTRAYPTSRPLPTLTSTDAWTLVEPFLVEYYCTGDARGISGPVGTITTHDRYALVEPDRATLDIRFRMLQPHERSAAMSFPKGYKFAGTRSEQVKQIGNAVAVGVASALCSQVLQ
jgi:DNA (cytosine-5)-methyltransferase 1